MTAVVGVCGSCGAGEPIGAVRCFRGAGTVLRCGHCDGVLMKIVERDAVACVDLTGLRSLG